MIEDVGGVDSTDAAAAAGQPARHPQPFDVVGWLAKEGRLGEAEQFATRLPLDLREAQGNSPRVAQDLDIVQRAV